MVAVAHSGSTKRVRASLILALAGGKGYTHIEGELITSGQATARWKARFENDGMAGLETQHLWQQASNGHARAADGIEIHTVA